MAETLLAILLLTSSAKGSNLVYRWPPFPKSPRRLARPRPQETSQIDNPWLTSKWQNLQAEGVDHGVTREDDDDYEWKRPNSFRDRSQSFSNPMSPVSRPTTPAHDSPYVYDDVPVKDEYNEVLGYHADFLGSFLCPKQSLCHRKFELIVDDLAFIGHPVSADPVDGVWCFNSDKVKQRARGREYGSLKSTQPDEDSSPSKASAREISSLSAWLQTFHLVFILDLPDPSSQSGNVSKYFDVIYEQIAFTVTAILFQEQVLSNFVEAECDVLGSLREEYLARGESYLQFSEHALKQSTIAQAMKTLFEAIKSSSMAWITIHDIPMEVQLPPNLDFLLQSNDDLDEADFVLQGQDEDVASWGKEMSLGWKLPTLAPWKALLLLGDSAGLEQLVELCKQHVDPGDNAIAEGLVKFLKSVSTTISLADLAASLAWDLESQVFPVVRWLVHRRRAKLVDIVDEGLKTIFTLPPKFDLPLVELVAEFEKEFADRRVPPLSQILSTISMSTAKQSDAHLFAAIVRSKDRIPLYHDVVNWMLRHDMLIALHLRIRVVATEKLKKRARAARDQARLARRKEGWSADYKRTDPGKAVESQDNLEKNGSRSRTPWVSFSLSGARKFSRRLPSALYGGSQLSELALGEEPDDTEDTEEGVGQYEEDEIDREEAEFVIWEDGEIHHPPTMINDPGRATSLQRLWLATMSEGKDPSIAKRFERINQYFDGKKTDDEILYRADITRKQLHEVLHHYNEYLQTFLHPS